MRYDWFSASMRRQIILEPSLPGFAWQERGVQNWTKTPVTQVFLVLFFIAEKPEIVSFCEDKTANCSEMKEATQFETIRLLCNVYAYPEAEVAWYVRGLNKSGADQQIDTLQNRMQNFRNGTLVIHNLRRNDTGWFRCFANNSEGNDSAMVYLRV